jgi:helicase
LSTSTKGYYHYLQQAHLTFKYDIGSEDRTVRDLFEFEFWVDPRKRWKQIGTSANRYQKCLKLIEALREDGQVLIYFQEKQDLVRFCGYAARQLPRLDRPRIERLVSYVRARLGDFPIVDGLPYGIAFHHGDLPVDVREEIEQAYRDGLIRVLACTTTLAEGVNLPIKTFILGYHQTWGGKHRLSVRDFKNIIGRAGRALLETEGRVILVRHPEFDRGKGNEDSVYFDKLVNLDPAELEVESVLLDDAEEVAQELDRLALAIQDEQDLARVEYQRLVDELSRLQVLIFTLYEDGIVDLSYESIEAFFKRTLLGVQDKEERVVRSASRFGERLVAISSKMDEKQLRRFNASGLRYASNTALASLAESIVHRVKDYDLFELTLETIISREDLKSILEGVWEAQPKAREYPRKAFEVVRDTDHYGLLLDWVGGMEFSELRDKHFQSLKEPIRTAICQHYIASQLSFRLPWVLGALRIHVEPYGYEWINTWFDILPGLVKYGVDSAEAVYFCSIGVQSRFLARRLAELYHEEAGLVSFTSWEPLEGWFLHLAPFDLRERAPDLPELSVRQVMRRINSMRGTTDELRKQGWLTCVIAGWKYYHGETFVDEFRMELRQQRWPRVQLNHEPDNEFDEYAVSVHYGPIANETRIGYIPREYNEEVATLLAFGERIDARIVSIDQQRKDWRPVALRLALIR